MLCATIRFAYNTDVDLCCTCCPALLPCMRHHLLFLGDPCFTTTAPGERWSCMPGWHVSMQRPPVVHASSYCKVFCKDYLLVPWKGLLQSELQPQHGLVHEFFEYASWVITCCACPPSSALLGRIDSLLKEQCQEACLNTATLQYRHPL
jgi:hypothetical protein